MDGMTCKEPHFQWDEETQSCLGCIEDKKLNDACRSCDDYSNKTIKPFNAALLKKIDDEKIVFHKHSSVGKTETILKEMSALCVLCIKPI